MIYFAKHQIWFLILALTSLIGTFINYRTNLSLVADGELFELRVLDKACLLRSGSSLVCDFNGSEYSVSISREMCPSVTRGSTVELIHNNILDYFFFPTRVTEYRRHVVLAAVFLFFSLLPYNWISSRLNFQMNS